MKKERIIRKGLEFTDIINNGKYVSNAFYSIYYINKKETLNRFGISVPKKIGHAVVRNKIKRQLKSIINSDKNSIQNDFDYVIIVRKGLLDLNYFDRQQNFFKLMKKIGDANE